MYLSAGITRSGDISSSRIIKILSTDDKKQPLSRLFFVLQTIDFNVVIWMMFKYCFR